MNAKRSSPSLIWPALLIIVGTIWLLGNLGVLLPVHTISLIQLWPLVLIVIGLDLVFGNRYRHASLWIGLGAVVVVAAFFWIGPGIGLVQAPTRLTSTFNEPIGNADSAEVNLRLSIPRTEIKALTDSTDAFFARIDHVWAMYFFTEGDKNKVISLRREELMSDWFTWMAIGDELRWEIGLTPRIPLKLNIDGGVGTLDLNLSGVRLKELLLDMGAGSTILYLPNAVDRYLAKIKGGAGSLDIELPCTNADIRMNTGAGSIQVNLANGCGIRVEVNNSGNGKINLPAGLIQVRRGNKNNEGIWESADYPTSKEKLLVVVEDGGPGELSIR